jgi:iron complex transport system permease protein
VTTARRVLVLGALMSGTVLALALAITVGSVAVPLSDTVRVLLGTDPQDPRWTVVIQTVRLPRAVTAALAGAALGVAGLQMQTLFRNPLADPFSLGVSSGASLGVSLTMVGTGGFAAGLAAGGRLGVVAAAALGAAVVLTGILVLARVVRTPVTLLVIGVMVGAAATALVSLLLTWTDPQRAQQFISWGLGSFSGTTTADLTVFGGVTAAGLLVAALSAKPLNALLLGENYARTMGLNVRRARIVTLLSASLLAGAVTAFCGPIGFLGIAVPHVARRLLGTSDHRVLLPATLLAGALTALLCAVASQTPGGVVPINVITSLIGAPVVIAILLRARSLQGVTT